MLLGPCKGLITSATVRDATGWDALVTELEQPGLVRHGLRHTALAWMADAGVDLHILQQVAGHLDPAVRALRASRCAGDAGRWDGVSAWGSVIGPVRPPLGVIEGGKSVG
jgi:hypothetical protein